MRFFIGFVLSLFTLLATFEVQLASEMFRRCNKHDQFRKAFRRASFYARRSWLNINVSKDQVFVFCTDLTIGELQSLRRFLERRRNNYAPGQIDSDLSYVSAMLTIQSVGCSDYGSMLDLFNNDADQVLRAISKSPADLQEPPVVEEKGNFDVDSAAHALTDFSDLMSQHGFTWFVLSGTLLGIVREGGFLKHDYDIDVGVMGGECDLSALMHALKSDPRFRCDEMDEQVIFKRNSEGLLAVETKPVFMKVSHQGGIHLDIFVHYSEDGITWHASSLFRWDNADFELTEYALAGVAVKGPKDADLYLTENYGNWRVPMVDFNSALDTTNQQIVCNPLSLAIFMRRIWLIKKSCPDDADSLMLFLEKSGFVAADKDGHFQINSKVFAL